MKDCEEEHASGLFWQAADRLFQDFPKIDLGLPAEVETGTRLGPCVVESVLGQGSFGKVFSATNIDTSEKEALGAGVRACSSLCGSVSVGLCV